MNETYTSPRGDHLSPRYLRTVRNILSSYFLSRSINLQWPTKKLLQEPDDCTGTSPTVPAKVYRLGGETDSAIR